MARSWNALRPFGAETFRRCAELPHGLTDQLQPTLALGNARDALKSAANAKEAAKEAGLKADAVKGTADLAQRNSKDAIDKSARAKIDASKALGIIDRANERVRVLEGRIGGIETKVADRHVTARQANLIQRALAKWSNVELFMTIVNGDDETLAFGNELLETLARIPSWSIQLEEIATNTGMSGLVVRVAPEATDSERAFAADVVSALKAAGLQADGPTRPLARASLGGGRIRYSGKFNPQYSGYDPAAAHRPRKVMIEVSKRP